MQGGAGPAGSQLAMLQGGGAPVGQPMMPVGTGDIVLNADGEGKSRKGLVITLIVLVVLAIGAGVGYALWQSGVFGGGGSEIKKSFNEYANYLLYGTDSGDDIGEYKGIYYINYFDNENINYTDDVEEAELVKNYYVGLVEKLDTFSDKVEKGGLDEVDKVFMVKYAEAAKAYFEAMQTYILDEEEIINYYIKSGYDAASMLIDKYYGVLVGSSEGELSNLGEALVERSYFYLNRFNAYVAAGCTSGIVIDYFSCGAEVAFDYDRGIIELDSAIENILSSMRRDTLEGCWDVVEKLN